MSDIKDLEAEIECKQLSREKMPSCAMTKGVCGCLTVLITNLRRLLIAYLYR